MSRKKTVLIIIIILLVLLLVLSWIFAPLPVAMPLLEG